MDSNQQAEWKKAQTIEISCDLISAAKKHLSFLDGSALGHQSLYYNDGFLRAAEERYRAFLHLINESKLSSDRHFVPTNDIDLMWRGHQLNPEAYAKDTSQLLGNVLKYDIIDSNGNFSHTKKQWEDTYGRRYLRAGAGAPTHRDCHSPTSNMQLMLEVVGGRHVSKDKGTLFVRYHVESSTGVITMNTKQLPASPTPHWAESISMECTSSNGNPLSHLQPHFLVFELRWRSQSLWGDLRGSKCIGSVKIAWRELLESKCLSMEDWFPLTVKGGIKDGQKPPALHLALSVTPPTPLPHLERSKLCEGGMGEGHVWGSWLCKRDGNVMRKRSSYLDRDECGCRGHACNYQPATSLWDGAWGI